MGVFRGLVPRGRSVVLAIPAIMLLALWLVFLSIETGHPVSPKRLRARPRGAALGRKPVVRPAGRTTGGGSLFTQKRRSKNRPKAAQPRAASVTLGGGSARDIEASFHFVFVTECSRAHHQHFASVIAINSFLRTQHPSSHITEVIACERTTYEPPYWHPTKKGHSVPPNVHYAVVPVTKKFEWNYKAAALQSWLTMDAPIAPRNQDVVVIIEEDFLFLKPFPEKYLLEPGHVVGGFYAFGHAWLSFPEVVDVCGEKCTKLDEGAKRQHVMGPPILIGAGDLRTKIIGHWTAFVKRCYAVPALKKKVDPLWYGFIVAGIMSDMDSAVHVDLMASNSQAAEEWKGNEVHLTIRYCQRYHIGTWELSKVLVEKKHLLECSSKELQRPPGTTPEGVDVNEVWLAVTLVKEINAAITLYKNGRCTTEAERKAQAQIRMREEMNLRKELAADNSDGPNTGSVPRWWEESDMYKTAQRKRLENKYITFQTWGGGFNNERMSIELAVGYALLTKRTLVLPPPYQIYLLLKKASLTDYFDPVDLAKGVPLMRWAEFVNTYHHFEKLNPSNQKGIEDVAHVAKWSESGVFCFPNIPEKGSPQYSRLTRFATGRSRFYEFNKEINDADVVFFPKGSLFAHFYLYFFTLDVADERLLRNVIRSFFHYPPGLLERASRIVARLPKSFAAIHLRRGDLQYPEVRNVPGSAVFANTKELFHKGETIYWATDEKDKKYLNREFLDRFRKAGFKVATLSDYIHLIKDDTPYHFLGIIEQLVCTRARLFVSSRLSTFSAYIYRMRGYMKDVKNKDTFFTTGKFPDAYTDTIPVPPWSGVWSGSTWGREYPTAWEDWETPQKGHWWVG